MPRFGHRSDAGFPVLGTSPVRSELLYMCASGLANSGTIALITLIGRSVG